MSRFTKFLKWTNKKPSNSSNLFNDNEKGNGEASSSRSSERISSNNVHEKVDIDGQNPASESSTVPSSSTPSSSFRRPGDRRYAPRQAVVQELDAHSDDGASETTDLTQIDMEKWCEKNKGKRQSSSVHNESGCIYDGQNGGSISDLVSIVSTRSKTTILTSSEAPIVGTETIQIPIRHSNKNISSEKTTSGLSDSASILSVLFAGNSYNQKTITHSPLFVLPPIAAGDIMYLITETINHFFFFGTQVKPRKVSHQPTHRNPTKTHFL